ncbi:hypothetical protein B0H13DRAFT_1933974 [Mycena leptocephala]|nr:hypothetical protein B0H13DRAFT_1933974 [Mycena leptocephala]
MTRIKCSARTVDSGPTSNVSLRTTSLTGVIQLCISLARDVGQGQQLNRWFLSGEIVMLPDPRAEDQWREAKVLWYPARFLKHRPHAQNKKREFEFRFLQCIQWTRQEHELMQPSRHYSQDRKFCEELSKIVLRPEQIGIVRYPAFSSPNPPKNHPLIEIFDIAVAPLAKLLVSFPGDHPVVRSYNAFFMDRPEDHRDTHIERWLPEGLHQPERELTALMERPLQRLQDFRLVSVPGPERRYRVIGVGRAMLQLLDLQHELGEPLDLNGDTFDDLVEGDIKATQMESHEATRAMFLTTKPKTTDI